MTWTFGVIGTGTSSQKKNTLRLLITDTDTNRQLISDEGIYQLMTLEGNNLFRVAGSICRTLGDPRTVTRAVGDLRIGGEQFKSFQELAQAYVRRANSGLQPYVGGISQADKLANEQNSDRVVPFFRRTLLDFPGVLPETTAST